METLKGTLTTGQLADFTVLDRDLTKIQPAEILKTQVLRTVVAGKTVYSRHSSTVTTQQDVKPAN